MSRYDTRTTMFDQSGRLFQVEYALEAISHAGTALGILAKDGVLLATEKKVPSKLLEPRRSEKIYRIDQHVGCAVAGITSDANLIVEKCRYLAQRFRYVYHEPAPMDKLVTDIADEMQYFTQFGGLRPFGVSALFAGWDNLLGFQLFHVEPSGVVLGWKANAVGQNSQLAVSTLRAALRQKNEETGEWEVRDVDLEEAMRLAAKVFSKSIDQSSLTPEKLEFACLRLSRGEDQDGVEYGKPIFEMVSSEIVGKLLAEEAQAAPEEGEGTANGTSGDGSNSVNDSASTSSEEDDVSDSSSSDTEGDEAPAEPKRQ